MKIPQGLKNTGKFLGDTFFVCQVHAREVIAEKAVDFADFVEPSEEDKHEAAKIENKRALEAEIAKRAKPVDAKFQTVSAK
jgi:hypothetical protein